jgi:hypothetical protein
VDRLLFLQEGSDRTHASRPASGWPRLENAMEMGGIAAALGLGLALDLGLVTEERAARIFDRLEPLARLGRLEKP